jgi:hypothetical protein
MYSTWAVLKRGLIPTFGRCTATSLVFYSIWIPLNGFNQTQSRRTKAMLLSMQIAVSTTLYMVPLYPPPHTAPKLHARFLEETSCSQLAPPPSFSNDIHNCLLLPSRNMLPRHCLIFQTAKCQLLRSSSHKPSLPTRCTVFIIHSSYTFRPQDMTKFRELPVSS